MSGCKTDFRRFRVSSLHFKQKRKKLITQRCNIGLNEQSYGIDIHGSTVSNCENESESNRDSLLALTTLG